MLQESISQSLAGRTALLTLLPLSINELKKTDANLSLDHLLLNGFYPVIYQDTVHPTFVYKNYIATYLLNIEHISQISRDPLRGNLIDKMR